MLVSKALLEHPPAPAPIAQDLPDARHRFAPSSADEAAAIMRSATDERAAVLFHGHGTKQEMGGASTPDVVVSTARMDRLISWEPDDLTLVVEPGVSVREIESELLKKNQTAGLPEWDAAGTVGGVVATATSGYRRSRLGPIRDRMLQIEIVTGDGRIVHGGGRVVKNVSGYDLPRLATGSMGRLGLITSICLKLWPLPEAAASIRLDGSPGAALHALYRPLAVLQTKSDAWAMIQGTPAEVAAQVRAVAGDVVDGLHWPDPPTGDFRCSIRIRPNALASAVKRLPPDWHFTAQHGVGVLDAACDDPDLEEITVIRKWVEARDGRLVITRSAGLDIDPWGTPPAALDLQRRVIAGFDPYGVANPRRLPGGI